MLSTFDRITDLTPAPRTPRYQLEVQPHSRHSTILRAEGDLDMTALEEFADTLDELAHATGQVVVDLTDVTFMYSAVVSVLADIDHAHPGRLQVVAPTRPIRMLLDVLAPGIDVTEGTAAAA